MLPQWREWAIPLMRYDVKFLDIGHTGPSDATLLNHGDEDDRASEREPLASSPVLSEHSHRRRTMLSVIGTSLPWPAPLYLVVLPPRVAEKVVVERFLLLLCSKCLANARNSSASSINAFFA